MQKGSLCECTVGGDWISKAERKHPGPEYKQIVTCIGHGEEGEDYLVFEEYQGCDEDGERYSYHRMYFREIQPPMVIQLNEIMQHENKETTTSQPGMDHQTHNRYCRHSVAMAYGKAVDHYSDLIIYLIEKPAGSRRPV